MEHSVINFDLLSLRSLFFFYFSVVFFPGTTSHKQCSQSHGQHDCVHGFPEPVKSFITFVKLSQISCSKVHTLSYFSAQDCIKVSPEFAVVSKVTSDK